MKYKVRYEELHTFEEYVEADSKEEAIAQVKEEKELRQSFDANLLDWDVEHPDPIEIREETESYRSIPVYGILPPSWR